MDHRQRPRAIGQVIQDVIVVIPAPNGYRFAPVENVLGACLIYESLTKRCRRNRVPGFAPGNTGYLRREIDGGTSLICVCVLSAEEAHDVNVLTPRRQKKLYCTAGT